MSHWHLARDPFLGGEVSYVPVAGHEEAVARLVHTVETGQRRGVIRAGAGLGKSVVLARVLASCRQPSRRIARVVSPPDGPALLAGLASGLGAQVPGTARRGEAWQALAEAVRLCRWQRLQVVLAIDDAQDLTDPSDRHDLDRLAHLDPHPDARLTVLAAIRTTPEAPGPPASPWDLAITLPALTRSQVEQYVSAKLAAAGRTEPTFTPRALNALHALTEGTPRGLDRLASLALLAGAVRGLEIIPPDVIEGVALECEPAA